MKEILKASAIFIGVVTVIVAIVLTLPYKFNTRGLTVIDTDFTPSTVSILIKNKGSDRLYNIEFYNQYDELLNTVDVWLQDAVVVITIYHHEELFVKFEDGFRIKLYG